jgi:general secretion pathway protein M
MRRGGLVAEFWGLRSRRERAVLIAAGVLVILTGLYAFLWEPGLAARAKLARALPQLRAQLSDMRQHQEEIVALRNKLRAEAQPSEAGPLLRAAAARAPFAKSVQRVDALSADRALLRAEPIEFDAWLDWVVVLQAELGLRLEMSRITALDRAGLVRVEATYVSVRPATSRGAP